MELWIRSQDRKQLTKTTNLEIDYNKYEAGTTKWSIISRLGIDHYNSIGVYDTEKRALEVLDEIQNELEKRQFGWPIYIGFYEMPKE